MAEHNQEQLARPEKKPMSRMMRSSWVSLAILLTLADLGSKRSMFDFLSENSGKVELTFFLNLVSVSNTGAAFGFLADWGIETTKLLGIFSAALVVGLYMYIYLNKKLTHISALIAILFLSGGAGNGVERLVYGRVFDFIDFHLVGYHFPAFNLADMLISLGLIVATISIFMPQANESKN